MSFKVGYDGSQWWGWINNDLGYISVSNSDRLYPLTSAGFTAAALSVNTTGGTVFLPDGTFTLTQGITINHNVRIIGAGVDNTYIEYTDTSRPCIRIDGPSFSPWNPTYDIHLSDFTISGDGGIHPGQYGILMKNSTYSVTVDRVRVHEMGDYGICLANAVFLASFTDCVISTNVGNVKIAGIYGAGNQSNSNRFTNCYISSSHDSNYAVLIQEGCIENMFTDCHFEGNNVLVSLVRIKDSSNQNQFIGCEMMDNIIPDGGSGVYISETAVRNSFIGGYYEHYVASTGLNSNPTFYLSDSADYNIFQSIGIIGNSNLAIWNNGSGVHNSYSGLYRSSGFVVNGTFENTPEVAFIRNSLGFQYPPTQSGLQGAINNIGNTSGKVTFPEGQKLTTTSTIYIWENVSVDMGWAQVIPTGDYDVFRVYRKSSLENVYFNLTTSPLSNTSACIRPYGVYAGAWEEFDSERPRTIRNIYIMGQSTGANKQKGIGILLYPSAACTSPSFGLYEHITARYINCTIRAKVDTAQYVNFNRFSDIKGVGNAYHIWLTDSANEISMNTFAGVRYEAEAILNEHHPIYLQGDCNYNTFYIDGIMDWAASGETTDYIKLADTDVDLNIFYGYVSATPTLFIDLGDNNNVFGSDIKITGSTTDGINVTNINPTGGGGTSLSNGVNFFKSTASNPYIRLYGKVSGVSKYGLFRIDTADKLEISTGTSSTGIDLEPGTTRMNLTSVLRLVPRATAPTTALEGDLYYDDTYNKLRIRSGTTWYNVTMT